MKTQRIASSFFDPTQSVAPLSIVAYPDRVLITWNNSFFCGSLSHEIRIREYAYGKGSAYIRQWAGIHLQFCNYNRQG